MMGIHYFWFINQMYSELFILVGIHRPCLLWLFGKSVTWRLAVSPRHGSREMQRKLRKLFGSRRFLQRTIDRKKSLLYSTHNNPWASSSTLVLHTQSSIFERGNSVDNWNSFILLKFEHQRLSAPGNSYLSYLQNLKLWNIIGYIKVQISHILFDLITTEY